LAPDACEPYRVPPSSETALSYRGLPYDLLEDLLTHSAGKKWPLPRRKFHKLQREIQAAQEAGTLELKPYQSI